MNPEPSDELLAEPGQTEASDAPSIPLELAFARRRLAIEFLSRLAVDPTGARVAYVVITPPERSHDDKLRFLPSGLPVEYIGHRIHIVDMDGGKSTEVGPHGATSWRPSWSPDGQQLAFYSDHGGYPQLWVHHVDRGESRPVSSVRIKAKLWVGDEPCWSPDGSELFVPLTPPGDDHADSNTQQHATTPTSDTPTVRVYRAGVNAVGDDLTQSDDPAMNAFYRQENLAELGAIRVADGTLRTVVPADAAPQPSLLQLSPSGRWVSYESVWRVNTGADDADDRGRESKVHDLAAVSAAGGPVATLAANVKVSRAATYHAGSHLWHPTHDQLFWVADHKLWTVEFGESVEAPCQLATDLGKVTAQPLKVTRDGAAIVVGIDPIERDVGRDPQPSRLAVVPLDGDDPTVIPLPEHLSFEAQVGQTHTAAWEPDPNTITILGRELATAKLVMVRFETTTGAATTIWKGLGRLQIAGASPDHHVLVAGFEDFNTPADLYAFGPDGDRKRRLTTIEPRLEGITFGPVETVGTSVPQPDGRHGKATTAVLLPPGAKRGDRLPAVMFIYPGGRETRYASEFGGGTPSGVPIYPLMASGYAVLLAEAPIGAPGNGGQDPIADLTSVLVPQATRAASLDYIDVDRVAVAGQSYGAYGAAGIISATHLFRAAIAIDGEYDLPDAYGRLDQKPSRDMFWFRYYETGQGRMGTHPWADLQRYLDNSPYYRADRIRTPLLLIHGAEDDITRVTAAGKMFQALRRLGKVAELAIYDGEGHVPTQWSRPNAVDMVQRIIDFLDQNLKAPK